MSNPSVAALEHGIILAEALCQQLQKAIQSFNLQPKATYEVAFEMCLELLRLRQKETALHLHLHVGLLKHKFVGNVSLEL